MDNQIQADLLELARMEVLEDHPEAEIISFKHLEGSVVVFFVVHQPSHFMGDITIHYAKNVSLNRAYDWTQRTGFIINESEEE